MGDQGPKTGLSGSDPHGGAEHLPTERETGGVACVDRPEGITPADPVPRGDRQFETDPQVDGLPEAVAPSPERHHGATQGQRIHPEDRASR
jgi:hypothetical protein